MKKMIFFILFILFLILQNSLGDTVYSGKEGYETFKNNIQKIVKINWSGRNYKQWYDNKDRGIFVHLIGDSYDDEISNKIYGSNLRELDNETRLKGIIYKEYLIDNIPVMLISAKNTEVLIDTIKTDKEFAKIIKYFCTADSTKEIIYKINKNSYKNPYIGNGPFYEENIDIYNKVLKIKPNPDNQFYWPYFIFIPKNIKNNKKKYILVIPNNSPSSSDDMNYHEEYSRKIINRYQVLASELNIIALVPIFHRPSSDNMWHYGTLWLNKEVMFQNKYKELERIDLQLIAMINDLKEKLKGKNIIAEDKIIMDGFSSSGEFINRFTILHPDIVKTAIIGAAGLYMIPIKNYKNNKLNYPIGIYDYEKLSNNTFDINLFKNIKFYFYMGEKDTNDPAPHVPEQLSSESDVRIVHNLFSNNLTERFKIVESIFKELDCNSEFKIYKNIGHGVNKDMEIDIKNILVKSINE